MKFLSRFRGITTDLIYSVLGLVVMHGVIQLVLYPTLNRSLGYEKFGTVLTLISIISIMSATFGTAANYSRMVSFQRGREVKGDYNVFLLVIILVSIPVSVAGLVLSGESEPVGYIVYIALMAATILRYYADVEFRLNINYKRFFVYYLLISLGYLLGIVLFKMTGMWMLAMIIGEVSAVLYVVFAGHIFRKPLFEASDYIRDNMKTFLVLSCTEIIGTLVLNADRLLLKIFVDSAAVTVFYAATLIGKTIALVSMPLNSVIIGHLARFEGKMSRKLFCGFCAGGALLSLPVNLFCTAISYVFVQIMYPDVFDVAKDYFFIANLGQILYFISSTLTVVLLRFTKEKYQLVINVIYFIVFLILAVPMTYVNGVTGMAWAIVSANLFKILVIMLVGVRVMKGEKS